MKINSPNIFYKTFERIFSAVIQLSIQLFLARLLFPSDFGLLSLILVFIGFSQILSQSGLTIGLLQDKFSNLAYSSVFWFSMFLSVIIYLIVLLFSTSLELIFNVSNFAQTLNIMMLIIFFNPFQTIFSVIVIKNSLYFAQLITTVFSTITYAFLAIILSLNGLGVWSVFIALFFSYFITTILYLIQINWFPRLTFNFVILFSVLKKSYSFLFSSILIFFSDSIYSIFIGTLSADSLGYYSRGQKIPQTIFTTIDTVIAPLSLTFFLKKKSFDNSLDKFFDLSQKVQFIIQPIFSYLFIFSREIILILLSERWLESVIFMRYFIIEFYIFSTLTIFNQYIVSIGKNSLFLRLNIIKVFLSFLSIIISIKIGFNYFFPFRVFFSFILLVYAFSYLSIISKTNVLLFFKKIYHDSWITMLMILVTYSLLFFFNFSFLGIFVSSLIGFMSYVILSYLTKNKNFIYILSLIGVVIGG